MKYGRFFLENFRGARNRLEFDMDMAAKCPHCVIGNNESDKTTLLRGIELISKLCEGEQIDNGARNALRPKGNYFSGIVKLGAELSFAANELEEKDQPVEEQLYNYLTK